VLGFDQPRADLPMMGLDVMYQPCSRMYEKDLFDRAKGKHFDLSATAHARCPTPISGRIRRDYGSRRLQQQTFEFAARRRHGVIGPRLAHTRRHETKRGSRGRFSTRRFPQAATLEILGKGANDQAGISVSHARQRTTRFGPRPRLRRRALVFRDNNAAVNSYAHWPQEGASQS